MGDDPPSRSRERREYIGLRVSVVWHTIAMDPFGYNAASSAPMNGYNMGPTGNGWSPHRDELAELIRRLRQRYNRRRLFRRHDVENMICEIRGNTILRPPPAPRIPPTPVELMDLTQVQE